MKYSKHIDNHTNRLRSSLGIQKNKNKWVTKLKVRKLVLAIALSSSVIAPNILQAATYTVTNVNDSGVGSFRRAITDANNTPGVADTIDFSIAAGSTINLGNELTITDSVTITGPTSDDPRSIVLNGGSTSAGGTNRHIYANGSLNNMGQIITLENLTLQNGYTTNRGGAVKVVGFDLVLNHTTLLSNNSNISSNTFSGGGLYARSANVTLNHSTVSNNSSFGDGGGILVTDGNLTLNQSTVSNNTTVSMDSPGGGILVDEGNLTLNQSTVSNNSTLETESSGGGIFIYQGDLTLNQSTVSNNSTQEIIGTGSDASNGGGIFALFANVTLTKSMVLNNKILGGGEGGGIDLLGGNLTLTESSVLNNSTLGAGGGLSLHSGNHVFTQSTISNNVSEDSGGGIFTFGDVTLIQSTVSHNSTTDSFSGAGGMHMFEGNLTAIQSTITNNSSNSGSGGIRTSLSSEMDYVSLTNSILSGNIGPEGNFEDSISNGDGLFTVNTSLFGDPITEIDVNNGAYLNSNNDPELGILQYNGGLTPTHKPNESSPAVDAGNNSYANEFIFDQRGSGVPRIHNTTVDMGSVELQNNSLAGDPPLNPNEILTRRDMAREFLKKLEGENYIPLDSNNNNEPYQVVGTYDDVGIGDVNAVFIEEFERRGFTEGCDTDKYCPDMVVTREQMARVFTSVFYSGSTPPGPSGNAFDDVPPGSFSYARISVMRDQGFSDSCDANNFCPDEPVTREWFDFLLNEL